MALAMQIANHKQFCPIMIELKMEIKIDHAVSQLPIILFILSFSFMELLSLYNFFELEHSSKAVSVTLRHLDHTGWP